MTTSPTSPVPRPPRPSAPRHGNTIDADSTLQIEIPDERRLAELSVKEHVVVFEELHRTLSEHLDDAGTG